jgi:hypothetical protein
MLWNMEFITFPLVSHGNQLVIPLSSSGRNQEHVDLQLF